MQNADPDDTHLTIDTDDKLCIKNLKAACLPLHYMALYTCTSATVQKLCSKVDLMQALQEHKDRHEELAKDS